MPGLKWNMAGSVSFMREDYKNPLHSQSYDVKHALFLTLRKTTFITLKDLLSDLQKPCVSLKSHKNAKETVS